MNELAKKDVPMSGGMVQLNSASDALFFADQVFKSGLAPTSFKSAQSIFVAVQQGAELGLKPMQSLQGICVVNGRTALMEKCARGLALSSGSLESIEERFEGSGDDLTAICVVRRKGLQNAITGKFSVADAKRAGLWGKVGPWTNYSKDMLSKKASTRALNGAFSDVLIGLPIFEDIQDTPPEKIAPVNPNPVEDPLLTQFKAPTIRQLMETKAANPTRKNPIVSPSDLAEMENIENEYRTPDGANIVSGRIDGGMEDVGLGIAGSVIPDTDTPTSEPPEIHPDDLDYAESQAKIETKNMGANKVELPAGASVVEGKGPLEIHKPKSEKSPWNIVIGGIRMAVWKKALPKIIEWLEKGNRGQGKNWRANYTTEVGSKYTNHTMVSLEVIE